jgi:hypothetical protein
MASVSRVSLVTSEELDLERPLPSNLLLYAIAGPLFFGAAQKAAYGFVRKAFSERSGIAPTDATFETAFNRYKQLGFFPTEFDLHR